MQVYHNQLDAHGRIYTLVKLHIDRVFNRLVFNNPISYDLWNSRRQYYVLVFFNSKCAGVVTGSERTIDLYIKDLSSIDIVSIWGTRIWDFVREHPEYVANQIINIARDMTNSTHYEKPAARRKCDCPIDVLMGQGCQCGGG